MFMKQVDTLTFVRGAGHVKQERRDSAHVRAERPDEHDIAVPVADYCCVGERYDGEANARCIEILDKWVHSHTVPHKETKHPWGARKMADAMMQKRLPEDHREDRQ